MNNDPRPRPEYAVYGATDYGDWFRLTKRTPFEAVAVEWCRQLQTLTVGGELTSIEVYEVDDMEGS